MIGIENSGAKALLLYTFIASFKTALTKQSFLSEAGAAE